ncbi:hypothetical protein TJA_03790 [Thermus sp. LT1-2-5]
MAERLRQTIGAQSLGVTASFGVAEYLFGEEEESLFRAAHTLYGAKNTGRNRVEVAE